MIAPASDPTWLRSRWSPPSTTSVASPRTDRARATCSPRSPPPTTTALCAAGIARRRRVQSSRLRKACTFSCRRPSTRTRPRIGGKVGMLPVASTSAS